MSKVSYIAPSREIGIVVAVLMGSVLLNEPFGRDRSLAHCFRQSQSVQGRLL